MDKIAKCNGDLIILSLGNILGRRRYGRRLWMKRPRGFRWRNRKRFMRRGSDGNWRNPSRRYLVEGSGRLKDFRDSNYSLSKMSSKSKVHPCKAFTQDMESCIKLSQKPASLLVVSFLVSWGEGRISRMMLNSKTIVRLRSCLQNWGQLKKKSVYYITLASDSWLNFKDFDWK